jgi:xanthine dehydrogenase YagT iron-sulfur-binding subunit
MLLASQLSSSFPAEAAAVQVSFFVNDRDTTLDVDPRDVLVDVLRDALGLTGSKKSCGHGNCGSCTVLLGEHAVYACLVLAVECEGARITTIEGLGNDGSLDALQRAFIENDAMQCGFCTPGQIMSIKELEQRGERLSDERLRLELSGNLCRCGAYQHIHAAAKSVLAARGREAGARGSDGGARGRDGNE